MDAAIDICDMYFLKNSKIGSSCGRLLFYHFAFENASKELFPKRDRSILQKNYVNMMTDSRDKG